MGKIECTKAVRSAFEINGYVIDESAFNNGRFFDSEESAFNNLRMFKLRKVFLTKRG